MQVEVTLPILVETYSHFTSASLLKLSMAKNIQFYYLLDDDYRKTLKQIKRYFTVDTEEAFGLLKQWMNEHEHFPPLELIWWFHKERVLLATTYFYIKKDYCNYFYQVFEEIYSVDLGKKEKQIIEIISGVLCALINSMKHSDDALQCLMEEIIDNLIIKITKMIESHSLRRSPIYDIKNCSYIEEECLKNFTSLHLKYILSLPSEYSVHSVVEIHTKQWTSNFLPLFLKEHIKEVLSAVPSQKVIEEINERVIESNFSWKYIFIIITVFIKNADNALAIKGKFNESFVSFILYVFQEVGEMIPNNFLGAVDSWLKQSLEEDHCNNLYLAVLIARHCCYEKARYFQSYANWFSTLNFKNSKFFTVFFQFLTEILPYEPPLYLKIHLNKVPTAPQGCQSLLIDYILLAKTRLSDLNESGEYIGLFSDYHETDEEGQQADVARVVAYYVKNREIAKPLLEAYVLRRQYYEKVFLKQLLKVPEREDADRAEVIRKLYSMGKVPSSLFNTWASL